MQNKTDAGLQLNIPEIWSSTLQLLIVCNYCVLTVVFRPSIFPSATFSKTTVTILHVLKWEISSTQWSRPWLPDIIIIIDNRWCLTPLLLSLPTAAYLGQHGLTPAGLPHTTAQCHLTILAEAVLFCLNHPSFRTPGSLSFCCRPFCRYGRRGAAFSVSLSAVGFLQAAWQPVYYRPYHTDRISSVLEEEHRETLFAQIFLWGNAVPHTISRQAGIQQLPQLQRNDEV